MSDYKNIAMLLLPVAGIVNPVFATEYLTVEAAQRALYPEMTRVELLAVQLSEEQIDKINDLSGVRQRTKNPKIWKVFKKDKALGWFAVDEVIGKHEFITYGIGISREGVVSGIEIMIYRETHGGEVRGAEWRNQFKGKKISDPFKLDKDVKNISGATLSCRNVLDGVKRMLILQKVVTGG